MKNQQSEFNSGKLQRVDQRRVLSVLLLCQARLVCLSNGLPSAALKDSALQLSKILVELDQSDLAVELALSNDVSPAFAIASNLDKLKNFDIRDGEDEEED